MLCLDSSSLHHSQRNCPYAEYQGDHKAYFVNFTFSRQLQFSVCVLCLKTFTASILSCFMVVHNRVASPVPHTPSALEVEIYLIKVSCNPVIFPLVSLEALPVSCHNTYYLFNCYWSNFVTEPCKDDFAYNLSSFLISILLIS